MKQIRNNVFETNSSSTHSLTILSKEQFENWKNGEIFKARYGDNLYTKDEFNKLVEEIVTDNNIQAEEVIDNADEYELPQTYREYCDDDYLDVDVNRYKPKSGDEIIIICKYGRNG